MLVVLAFLWGTWADALFRPERKVQGYTEGAVAGPQDVLLLCDIRDCMSLLFHFFITVSHRPSYRPCRTPRLLRIHSRQVGFPFAVWMPSLMNLGCDSERFHRTGTPQDCRHDVTCGAARH